MPRLALAVLLVFAALVPRAAAATGDLTQLPDPFGCNYWGTVNNVCTATTALHQVEGLAMSPDGTSVYAAVSQSEAIVHFVRNPMTGSMDQPSDPNGCVGETAAGPCIDGEFLKFPSAVAVSPDGKNVYAAVGNSEGVAILDRDPATGMITQRTAGVLGCVSATGDSGDCMAATGLGSEDDIAVSPDNKAVYVVGENSVVTLARDPATGNLSQAIANGCTNQTGTGGCADGRALYDLRGITISPDGNTVYTASAGTDNVEPGMAVFDRDPATDALTQRSGTSGCVNVDGSDGCTAARGVDTAFTVAVSPDNKNVYLPSRSGALVVFDRDPATGVVTQKAAKDGCITLSPTAATADNCALGHDLQSPTDIAVSPDGTSVYMASQDIGGVDIFDRSTTTGVLVQRASPAGCIASVAFYITNAHCAAVKFMTNAWSLAVDPASHNVYVGSHDDKVGVLARDTGTATVTPTPTATVAPGTTPTPTTVASPPPTVTPTPVRLPPTLPPSRIVTVRVTVRTGNVTVESDTPGAGTVTVTADGRVQVSARSAHIAKTKKLKIARASKTVNAATRVTLVLKPKGKAKRYLHKHGKLKATLHESFRPVSGTPTTSTKKVTFRFKK